MANPAIDLRVRVVAGGSPPTVQFIEGVNTNTAESWYTGSLMAINTLGVASSMKTHANTTYASGAITTTTIASNAVGFAAAPSTFQKDGVGKAATATTATIPVVVMDQNVEFGLPVLHATNASSLPVKTLVGGSFELVNYTMTDGTVTCGVAIDRTSSPVFVVTRVPDGSVGKVNGIVYGKILSAERAPGAI